MKTGIERLLSVASDPLGAQFSLQGAIVKGLQGLDQPFAPQLQPVLSLKNGFYAFESALLFRPVRSAGGPLGIIEWNDQRLWKSTYHRPLDGTLFFAEDAFGFQFCLRDDTVASFDPETGEFKTIASDLEDWSKWILEDHKQRTGWPIAHFWQLRNGILKPGMRLFPDVPAVLGGQFSPECLSAIDEVDGIRFRADVAGQIVNCPDGSHVILRKKVAKKRRS